MTDDNTAPTPPPFDIGDCADRDTLTDDGLQLMITHALAWYCFGTGVTRITESNWVDLYARIDVTEKLGHNMVFDADGARYVITPDDVRKRIGLWVPSGLEERAEVYLMQVITDAYYEARERAAQP